MQTEDALPTRAAQRELSTFSGVCTSARSGGAAVPARRVHPRAALRPGGPPDASAASPRLSRRGSIGADAAGLGMERAFLFPTRDGLAGSDVSGRARTARSDSPREASPKGAFPQNGTPPSRSPQRSQFARAPGRKFRPGGFIFRSWAFQRSGGGTPRWTFDLPGPCPCCRASVPSAAAAARGPAPRRLPCSPGSPRRRTPERTSP